MTDPKNQSQSLLTSTQEHYLKKYLLGVLINNELNRLQKNPHETLPNLGGPFDLKDEHANSTTPFLRYLFESIIVPFPFLTSSKGALWSKLQLFMDEWAKIEAGNGVEREEMIRRKRLKNKGERTIVLMYSMAIKTVEQRAYDKKELIQRQQKIEAEKQLQSHLKQSNADIPRDNKHLRVSPSNSNSTSRSTSPSVFSLSIHGVRINVVGVRQIKEKRHVREHEHALRHDFPQKELPVPPSKYAAKSRSSEANVSREKDRVSLRGYLHSLAKTGQEIVDSPTFINFLTRDPIVLTEEEANDARARVEIDEHRMVQQEKFDREVAKKVDELDAQLKEVKLDILQPGGISRLFSAFRNVDNVNDLPELYQSVFEWGCMNFASTLYHVFTSSDNAALNFTQLKRTHMLMPYRTMWGILKISNPMAMMKGIMDLFLAQPFGSRSLVQRIISGNMNEEVTEYKKEIEEIEDAIADPSLCEKIRNYVYAPVSVTSQIFSSDEIYDITELGLIMDVLKSDLILPVLDPTQVQRVWEEQQKLEQDRLEQEHLKELAKQSGSGSDVDSSDKSSDFSSESNYSGESSEEGSPRLAQEEVFNEIHHSKPHRSRVQQEPNLVRQLQQLLVAHLRIREKERLMGLVFQGVTGEILREVIAIFYEPLVKVYKAANFGDTLMDLRNFIDELIKIIEQAEVNDGGATGGPSTATLYLNLVRKHLPSFYRFVHAVHKQDDGIFHDLLDWIEGVITFMRTGYGHPRFDYKTEEELRVGIDLNSFVKENIKPEQWEQIQKEAETLRVYFVGVKDRKREEVRHMAGLDRAVQAAAPGSPTLSGNGYKENDERQRVVNELKNLGLQQEDVDELEMINWDSGDRSKDGEDDDADGEMGLKVPKVPTIDNLLDPFVSFMDKALFRTSRE
ncbi:hypothetical protein BGZ80_007782 [Entomortierella chlamydospora]|uniref:Uncharacterized protein n=1 Tax=Entomortierella chlamydospora TaxID=101097 RepID=A0A9P6MY39_9FUNG|nr:hypothetical protein BGZ79_009514 [Entomortierella chlamydospora]KAG0017918.1 hypothetical protein BGZ80_007782 [Entomortierella chlamydospora]